MAGIQYQDVCCSARIGTAANFGEGVFGAMHLVLESSSPHVYWTSARPMLDGCSTGSFSCHAGVGRSHLIPVIYGILTRVFPHWYTHASIFALYMYNSILLVHLEGIEIPAVPEGLLNILNVIEQSIGYCGYN